MVLEGRRTYGATCSNLATGEGLTVKISFKRWWRGGSASKRVTSVTFTFMCPWERARQERETFFDSFSPHSRRTLLIRALPYGGVDPGSRSKGMMQKKRERERRNKGVPYVCLFLFISLWPNRSSSSATWLKTDVRRSRVAVCMHDSRPQTALFRDSDRALWKFKFLSIWKVKFHSESALNKKQIRTHRTRWHLVILKSLFRNRNRSFLSESLP